MFRILTVDDRFPSDAIVEFVFSSGPEKIKGEINHFIGDRKKMLQIGALNV